MTVVYAFTAATLLGAFLAAAVLYAARRLP